MDFVPIVDAADERRDQLGAGVGAGDRLAQREQQGHVAADAFLFQDLGGADAFPGGGHLDEHAFALDAGCLVQLDQVAALGHRAFDVERQAGVDLGRDAARDDAQDLLAEGDQQVVDGVRDRAVEVVAHGFFQQRLVFVLCTAFRISEGLVVASRGV